MRIAQPLLRFPQGLLRPPPQGDVKAHRADESRPAVLVRNGKFSDQPVVNAVFLGNLFDGLYRFPLGDDLEVALINSGSHVGRPHLRDGLALPVLPRSVLEPFPGFVGKEIAALKVPHDRGAGERAA